MEHTFVPCQDPLGCVPSFVEMCHRPRGSHDECGLPENHPMHNQPVDEATDLEVDEYRLILEMGALPNLDYTTAEAAIQKWLDDQEPRSRLEEADLLQDCLARVLVHLTEED